LYADDIVLLASSAEELRGMLARCQAFADESSFQFSLDKSQILIFGEPEPDEEFLIMHQGMKHVQEYTYLGLVFHSSLGRVGGIGTRDKLRKFDGKKFFDGDTGETREIVDIFDDEKFGWVAETKGDDGSLNHYGLESVKNKSDMDRMIAQYSAEYGVAQEDTRLRGAWDLHRERITRKLASKAAMLRRLGCYPEGLDAVTARLVASTMCDAISVDSRDARRGS